MEKWKEGINRFLIEANRFIYEWRVWLADFWSQGFHKWLVLLLVALTILVVLLFRRGRRSRQEASLLQGVSQDLAQASSQGNLTSLFFKALFKAIPTPAAGFYLATSPKSLFLLKAKQPNPAFPFTAQPDWEPKALLETVPQKPGITQKGDVAVFSLPVEVEGHPLALVQLAMLTWEEAEEVQARAKSIRWLLTPILAQLVAFDRIQRLEERIQEASVVSGSSQTLLSTTLGADQLGSLLLDLAVRSTESQAGLILLNTATFGQQGIQVLTSNALDSPLPRELAAAVQESASPFPIEGSIVEPLSSGSRFTSLLLQAGFRSLLHVPIVVDATPLGSVILLRRDGTFRESHLRVCQLNATRLAFSFKNRTYHELVFREYKETLKTIVATLESSSPYFEGHSLRVSRLAGELAEVLGLSADEAEGIRLAGELHNVGMVGVGDEILLKAGRLTTQEYDLVKHHPLIGAALTAPIRIPIPIAPLILHHHERYDGFGYPTGLKGSEIPVGARILALGEVFDAMLTSRNYRQALTLPEAMARLKQTVGTQLDPLVVQALESLVKHGRLTTWGWQPS